MPSNTHDVSNHGIDFRKKGHLLGGYDYRRWKWSHGPPGSVLLGLGPFTTRVDAKSYNVNNFLRSGRNSVRSDRKNLGITSEDSPVVVCRFIGVPRGVDRESRFRVRRVVDEGILEKGGFCNTRKGEWRVEGWTTLDWPRCGRCLGKSVEGFEVEVPGCFGFYVHDLSLCVLGGINFPSKEFSTYESVVTKRRVWVWISRDLPWHRSVGYCLPPTVRVDTPGRNVPVRSRLHTCSFRERSSNHVRGLELVLPSSSPRERLG